MTWTSAAVATWRPARARRRTIRLSALAASLLALSACGAGPDRAVTAPAPAPAPVAPAPLTLGDLRSDPSLEHVTAALADGSPAGWAVRLEAIRLLRRERLPGFATTLANIAADTRSPFEQEAAMEALAIGYAGDAPAHLRSLATLFHGEEQDEKRVAVVILRYRIASCYDLAIALLCDAGVDALFSARHLILAGGPAMAPVLSQPHEGLNLQARLLVRMLASGIGGATQAQADGQLLQDANYPGAALAVYGEVYGAKAVPVLTACLTTDAVLGHPEAAEALGALGVVAAAPDIFRRYQELPVEAGTRSQRATYLLALGRLQYVPALDSLLAASHGSESATDADGVTIWPLAQASLTGLAAYPQHEAYDALIAALALSDRPTLVVAAAQALALRKDQGAERALAEAAHQLQDLGDGSEASLVAEAHENLLGVTQSRRTILCYLIRYHSADGTYTLLTDQPLIAVDEAGRTLRDTLLGQGVVQDAIWLSRFDIGSAIRKRNDQDLAHLRVGPERIDDVDMIAH